MLSGCVSSRAAVQAPGDGLFGAPEAPFLHQQKVEVPAESKGLSHFLKGHLLLSEGNFDEALKEFESASAINPDDAFLRFRLATLYVRKGDLKRALDEAEAAKRLDP
jgi:tetratricopeptide (TPR) repeat protein